MEFRPTAQYRQHAPYGEVEHEIGFKVEVVGVEPSTEINVSLPKSRRDSNELRRAVRSGEQREPVKTPTLFGLA